MKRAGELMIVIALLFVCASVQANDEDWYSFSPDGKVCHIYERDLPTPWFNRLTND